LDLDSGATDHICLFKSLFQNLKPIPPIFIQLPNQNSVIAKFSVTIVLGILSFTTPFLFLNFLFN